MGMIKKIVIIIITINVIGAVIFLGLLFGMEDRSDQITDVGTSILNNKIAMWELQLEECETIQTQTEFTEFQTDTQELERLTDADVGDHPTSMTLEILDKLSKSQTDVYSCTASKQVQFGIP